MAEESFHKANELEKIENNNIMMLLSQTDANLNVIFT